MFVNLIIKLTTFLLRKSNLSLNQRSVLVSSLLDKLAGLPLRDIISYDEEGYLLVNNQRVSREVQIQLKNSAVSILQNSAFKLVHDQVLFKAIVLGVHSVETPEQMFFSRSAIWWSQREIEILKLLASLSDDERELTP